MIKKTIAVALLLFSIPLVSSAASQPTSVNCSSIKDSKKRLACYDSATKQSAAEVNKAAIEPEKSVVVTKKAPIVQEKVQPIVDGQVKADRVISVEAGLVYKSGDVKPVARTEFYLLDESLIEIFKKENIISTLSVDDPNDPTSILFEFSAVHNGYDELQDENRGVKEMKYNYRKAIQAIAPHIVYKGTTSFSGTLKFENIKPGAYYLMGVCKTAGKGTGALWNYKVDTQNSETIIILDQNNAAFVN
ncbi:hypothetical protein GEOBRER4_n1981 [Citrifermentans bremense]|uniref:Uncharacterized protein n=1 Tax=Citrifermentans bremense TaxID=60035 RepID=A0A6S6M0P0_9BACT|nr:hypothetical protein [Citrifermentans bremense]BCG47158.1 hypothetical protein GEOBRER4_n1981 [Citrifermentans bremense]